MEKLNSQDFRIIAHKGDSKLDWLFYYGDKSLSIQSQGQTPNLSYDFENSIVSMSSGDYTPILPHLVGYVESIVEMNSAEDVKEFLIKNSWVIDFEKM